MLPENKLVCSEHDDLIKAVDESSLEPLKNEPGAVVPNPSASSSEVTSAESSSNASDSESNNNAQLLTDISANSPRQRVKDRLSSIKSASSINHSDSDSDLSAVMSARRLLKKGAASVLEPKTFTSAFAATDSDSSSSAGRLTIVEVEVKNKKQMAAASKSRPRKSSGPPPPASSKTPTPSKATPLKKRGRPSRSETTPKAAPASDKPKAKRKSKSSGSDCRSAKKDDKASTSKANTSKSEKDNRPAGSKNANGVSQEAQEAKAAASMELPMFDEDSDEFPELVIDVAAF